MSRALVFVTAHLIATVLFGPSAYAQANKTYVAARTGSDSGNCPITAPCKTFAYAINKTNSGGEIDVLEPGGYGTIVINQAITIVAQGVLASINTPSGGNGVLIQAGTSDAITLSGLTIDGHGTGANGIVFNYGGRLNIDNCVIRNHVSSAAPGGYGILMKPVTASVKISISNSVVSNNQSKGISYEPTGAVAALIEIDKVTSHNNYGGITIAGNPSGTAKANISGSTVSGNSDTGLEFANTNVSVDQSYIISNDRGLANNGGSTAYLGRSVVRGNSTNGVVVYGGSVFSYRDNRIGNNGADGTMTTATPN